MLKSRPQPDSALDHHFESRSADSYLLYRLDPQFLTGTVWVGGYLKFIGKTLALWQGSPAGKLRPSTRTRFNPLPASSITSTRRRTLGVAGRNRRHYGPVRNQCNVAL